MLRCLRRVWKGTICWRRLVAGYHFGIKRERNDVGDVVLLHGRTDLEADLTLRAAQELAVNHAAILQLQSVGPRYRRHQTKCNDQSAIQPELPHDFTSATLPTPVVLLRLLAIRCHPSKLRELRATRVSSTLRLRRRVPR